MKYFINFVHRTFEFSSYLILIENRLRYEWSYGVPLKFVNHYCDNIFNQIHPEVDVPR